MKNRRADNAYPQSGVGQAEVLHEASILPATKPPALPPDFTERLTATFHRAKKRALQTHGERSTRSQD